MAEADRNHKDKKLKRRILPPGTSAYQVSTSFPDPRFLCSLFYFIVFQVRKWLAGWISYI